MTNLMQGVVQHGTAAAANALDWPLAGKTGTVDDNTDAWFVGFDPNITVGVWMGNDEKKPIGYNETGTTAALPMWIDFMKVYIELYGDRENPPKFESPGNIVFMPVDRNTGEPASSESGAVVNEAFISGTQPVKQYDADDLGFRIEWISDQLQILRSSISCQPKSLIRLN